MYMNYKLKYIKYKNKYIELKSRNQSGGGGILMSILSKIHKNSRKSAIKVTVVDYNKENKHGMLIEFRESKNASEFKKKVLDPLGLSGTLDNTHIIFNPDQTESFLRNYGFIYEKFQSLGYRSMSYFSKETLFEKLENAPIHHWDSKKFLDDWEKLGPKTPANLNLFKNLNKLVAEHNMYLVQQILHIPIPISFKYNDNKIIDNQFEEKIIFINGTTDDGILAGNELKLKTCALNFANARHVGGGYLHGAIAQEEELCRQYPHLYASLNANKHALYPIELDKGEVLYTRNVARIRNNLENGYDVLNVAPAAAAAAPVFVDFVSAAAPNMNNEGLGKTFADYKINIELTLKRIMDIPAQEKCECIVMGAWGCGAFAPKDARRIEYIDAMIDSICSIIKALKKNYKIIIIAIPDPVFMNEFQKKLA